MEGRSEESPGQILDGKHIAYATPTAALSKLVACSVCLQARASWRGAASSCWASFWMSTRARQRCAAMCASQPSWQPTPGASRPSRCAADAQRVAAWSQSCRRGPQLSPSTLDVTAEKNGRIWAHSNALTQTHAPALLPRRKQWVSACKASLKRTGQDKLALAQLHWSTAKYAPLQVRAGWRCLVCKDGAQGAIISGRVWRAAACHQRLHHTALKLLAQERLMWDGLVAIYEEASGSRGVGWGRGCRRAAAVAC